MPARPAGMAAVHAMAPACAPGFAARSAAERIEAAAHVSVAFSWLV